jgi:hypothetical protein
MIVMEATMTKTETLTVAAARFVVARADRSSVEYAAARGAFYGAVLATTETPVVAPPVKREPYRLADIWYRGAIMGG